MQEQSLAEKRAAAKGARYAPDTSPAPTLSRISYSTPPSHHVELVGLAGVSRGAHGGPGVALGHRAIPFIA